MNYKYFKGMGDVDREQDGEGRGCQEGKGGKDVKGKGGRMFKARGMVREEG